MKKTAILLVILACQLSILSKESKNSGQSADNLNVVMLGSSTVWGGGLMDTGFTGSVDDYLKTSLSQTIMPAKMRYSQAGHSIKPENFRNPKLYKKQGKIIKGIGAAVEFTISGDELAICQVIRRTQDWGKMVVYADGKKIGSFNNKNSTTGSDKATFKGNGKQTGFELDRCFTYNHKVSVDGKPVKTVLHTRGNYMRNSPFTYYPEDVDCLVARKYSDKKPVQVIHTLLFEKAPPKDTVINVDYDYGKTICHTKSTVGESADDQQIESPYAIGRVSHDPANPTRISSGLDYRSIDKDSFWIHHFKDSKKRRIKIEIEGGKNPYFIINFATNRYHNLMNAGIGGWTAHRSLNDKFLRNYKHACKEFKPDIFFIALGGNDDWAERERLVKRDVKNVTEKELKEFSSLEIGGAKMEGDDNFTVIKNSGIIDSITPTSLTSKHLIGTNVKPGCFVRIGNYTGDNDSVAVRTIATFDSDKGTITWTKPVTVNDVFFAEKLDDLVGSEFAVRDIKYYSRNMRNLVKKLKEINPAMKIVLLNVYNTNYFTRQIWGYPELQKIIAAENENVYPLNAAKILQEWQKKMVSGKHHIELKADGSKEYKLPWKWHWQGYKVLVNGKNVYGKDCYILPGMRWARPPKQTGKALEFKGDYKRGTRIKCNQKLVFVKNAPKNGTIKIEKADTVWSGDYAHPNKYGIKVIGDACADMINKIK